MELGLSFVLVTPSLELRNLLAKALHVASGIAPVSKSGGPEDSAQRAHYDPMLSKLIINTAHHRMYNLLGPHSAVIAIQHPARFAAAEAVKQVFLDAGHEAVVHTHAEPEFPEGFIVFVSVPALKGIHLMFWPMPAEVTHEIAQKLRPQEPWTKDDFNVK